MRVLYFSRDYTPHDHRFLTALANTQHQVYYLRLERRGQSLEERGLPDAISPVDWLGGHAPARLLDGPRLLASLKKVIRSIQPDLIQAGPLQTAAFLVSLSGFRPLVSMSWGYDLLVDAGRNALWRRVTRYTLGRSAVMVGDCRTIRRKAIDHGLPDERIVTFPWGVDLKHFNPSPEAGAPHREHTAGDRQAFTLISTRGWEPIYGAELIARAFVAASQRLAVEGGPKLRLLMLGGGSQAGLLRSIFELGGVLGQVEFPGQVGQLALPDYYRSADLYVSASRSDGTSISLLEAMACGLPALVSDIPGNCEWVQPGVQGWWFPDGDPEGLTKGILQAVAMRASLPEKGRAARALVERCADWDKNFPQLLEAYELALEVTHAIFPSNTHDGKTP